MSSSLLFPLFDIFNSLIAEFSSIHFFVSFFSIRKSSIFSVFSSPVFVANVNSDPVVVSGDALDALNALVVKTSRQRSQRVHGGAGPLPI